MHTSEKARLGSSVLRRQVKSQQQLPNERKGSRTWSKSGGFRKPEPIDSARSYWVQMVLADHPNTLDVQSRHVCKQAVLLRS